ncbi:hypothetical protein YC2023_030908 [Brassica napus]
MISILFVVIVEISFSWLQGLDQLKQTKGMTQLGFTISLTQARVIHNEGVSVKRKKCKRERLMISERSRLKAQGVTSADDWTLSGRLYWFCSGKPAQFLCTPCSF